MNPLWWLCTGDDGLWPPPDPTLWHFLDGCYIEPMLVMSSSFICHCWSWVKVRVVTDFRNPGSFFCDYPSVITALLPHLTEGNICLEQTSSLSLRQNPESHPDDKSWCLQSCHYPSLVHSHRSTMGSVQPLGLDLNAPGNQSRILFNPLFTRQLSASTERALDINLEGQMQSRSLTYK